MTTKMPSESSAIQAQTEKPPHYMYLKEFRTQQCPLFLQHKCTQHRPFTCFHWHFMNQRRRRPVRKRDGTFNYSPDVYCTKFDETTGMCPEADECQFLHRTAGDTERRYHLRYYKTGTCVYETDSKGHCVKNGPHCAFAHGPMDLRPPVYDRRELQAMEQNSDISSTSPGTPSGSLEKERTLLEDPRWNDTNFVLANYKTEQCKKPPRLCRQGYACPHFHNPRDRRRSPKVVKYRSTPCPNVKHSDDWGDPTQCENSDNCGYCHTRTEQQFHPEIYKSTKCNDMVQTNYCPRGPFCAFAHVEQEITTQRDISQQGSSFLAAMISNLLPQSSGTSTTNMPVLSPPNAIQSTTSTVLEIVKTTDSTTNGLSNLSMKMPDPIGKERNPSGSSISHVTGSSLTYSHGNHIGLPEPIGKGRSSSSSSSITSNDSSSIFYPRCLSTDRDEAKLKQQLQAIDNDSTLDAAEKMKRKQNLMLVHNLSTGMLNPTITSTPAKLKQQLQAIDNDSTLDAAEKMKRKQNLMLVHNLSTGMLNPTITSTPVIPITTAMSPFAPAFYPPRETVGSVIEQALEDVTLDDIDINNLEKELDNDTNSLSSSISAGLSSGFGSSSIPIGIPPCNIPRGSVGSLSQSPPSPYGSYPHSILSMHSQKDSHTESFLTQNHMKFSGSPFAESPRSGPGGPHSPLYSHTLSNNLNSSQGNDIHRLQADVLAYKTKLEHWEQAYNQAKSACEAWKKEAEDTSRKVRSMEEEKLALLKQRDEALKQFNKLKIDANILKGPPVTGPVRFVNNTGGELDSMMLPQLIQIQQQLRADLEKVEQLAYKQKAIKCVICQDKNRCIATSPCNHCVMCEKCATMKSDCPLCRVTIAQKATVNYHL